MSEFLSKEEAETIFSGDLEEEIILGGEILKSVSTFGNEDPGETTEVNASSSFAWDQAMDLGEIEPGTFFHSIDGLVENEQFYFRISAENFRRSSLDR